MYKISIYEARNNLSALIKTAEQGECVTLMRHNKPAAVLVSYEEYEQLTFKPDESFTNALNQWRREWFLAPLDKKQAGSFTMLDEFVGQPVEDEQ